MIGDDADDGPPPLPPEDRLWRHPSELGGAAPGRTPIGRSRRGVAAVGVVSGLAGAAAAVVALAALGAFTVTTASDETDLVAASTSTTPTTAPSTTVATAQAVATSVAPAVVGVVADLAGGQARGSGVVARSDGLVLTSAQLVAGAGAVTVVWPSGREQDATLEGIDPETGLAALTVVGRGFPTATLDLSPPRRGEQAITVSAGAGGASSVVDGRVRAASTHVSRDGDVLVGLIATDTPIPADADGGALVDGDGNLRGVCLTLDGAGAGQTGGGWAVPAEVALRVADDLRRLGRVDRGWLGVSGAPVAVDGAVPAGFAVEAVMPWSPAETAGLRVGDVLLAVDDHRVRSLDDVRAALTLTRPGQTVSVELNRADQTLVLSIPLAATPE